MARRRRRVGEILLEWGLVKDSQLQEALKVASGAEKRIGNALVELGYVSDDDLAKALASQFDMEYIDLEQPNVVDKESFQLLPKEVVQKYLVVPVKKDNGRMKVLIHDPMDLELLDNLRFRLNCELETALAARSKIKKFIDQAYSETQASIDEAIRGMTVDVSEQSLDIEQRQLEGGGKRKKSDEDDANAGPVVKLVNQIMAQAVRNGTSDIHIEPFNKRVRLRYRIDGVCHEMEQIPKAAQAAVTARLKIMGGVKVQEKRIPQDGRIKLKVDGKVIDFRFAICPVVHGEAIVMRILRPDSARLGLEKLGMPRDTMEAFQQAIKKPNGIFLVTGPTGSGKTTTLYSALADLNRPDTKIITAEDPVEYNFPGINQCQVNTGVGLTFSKILKAMLRQAPNIVLVGEIRDHEVGKVAIEAALTGHLVFSTLHTNDAPSAITRLTDMGLKPFLVASAIQAVLAQRLVRVLCPDCKAVDEDPDWKTLRICGFTRDELKGKQVYKAVGCDKCGGTGFRGRRGVYEMMVMNSELRDLAFKSAPVSRLRAAAKASGMRDLLGDGKNKILDGMTTPEEISGIAQSQGVVDEEEDVDEPSAA